MFNSRLRYAIAITILAAAPVAAALLEPITYTTAQAASLDCASISTILVSPDVAGSAAASQNWKQAYTNAGCNAVSPSPSPTLTLTPSLTPISSLTPTPSVTLMPALTLASSTVTPTPSTTTTPAYCSNFDQYATCQKIFGKNNYECSQFTQNFCQECKSNAVQATAVTFSCSCIGDDNIEFGRSHAEAIIENVKEEQKQAKDCQSHDAVFCLIEPQNGHTEGCWKESAGTAVPANIPNAVIAQECGYVCNPGKFKNGSASVISNYTPNLYCDYGCELIGFNPPAR